MTDEKHPPAEQPDATPPGLKDAVNLMQRSEQRASLLPRLMKISFSTGVALILSVIGNGVQYWRATEVEREYFATDNGRLVRLAPTSQPAWSQNDVVAFGSDTLTRAFNLDFVHYREQISALSPRFSGDGYAGYVRALQSSNILEYIRRDRMNLSGTVGAGVVVRQGQLADGTWFWTIQYPVRMRLVGQTTSRPEQSFTFEITVQRVDARLKPSGMEIRQMISRNAPASH